MLRASTTEKRSVQNVDSPRKNAVVVLLGTAAVKRNLANKQHTHTHTHFSPCGKVDP
jgi:hypothetical protein